jgi:hypothetical protein
MGREELEYMQTNGRMIESESNGVTSVSQPPNPAAYRAAPPGSKFVQFDVPSSVIKFKDASTGWAKIYGPSSIHASKGGITEMPPVWNIVVPK